MFFDFELFFDSPKTNKTILNETTWLILSIQVHIMWCLEDRLLEREMRKGNSVISRVKLKTLYSSPFGMKKHEPNQKENSLGYATLLLKTIFFYAKM